MQFQLLFIKFFPSENSASSSKIEKEEENMDALFSTHDASWNNLQQVLSTDWKAHNVDNCWEQKLEKA